jgi:hypothetical protein
MQRATNPIQNVGLTFANTSPPGYAYGGGFGATICPPNYWATRGDTPVTAVNNGDVVGGNGKFYTDDDLTITGGSGVHGQKIIYVAGDVYIANDIRYNTGYTSLGDIPRLIIVASGDINIAPGVKQLDGLLVANGTISTCAGASGPEDVNNLLNNCNNQLIINGGLLANKINFYRSLGSLRDSQKNDDGVTRNNAAEIINYTPEMYLAPLIGSVSGGGGGGGDYNVPPYDAITSLPPIF